MQVTQVLRELAGRLVEVSESPSLDAQVLLAHILGVPRTWLLAHPDESLAVDHEMSLERAVQRLEGGEALPYVIGHWDFYGLDFTLTPDVLIPRPETELLVERALGWLGVHPGMRQAADIGTGSGCIAVALAAQMPDLQVLATDLSPAALEVARINAKKHAVASRVQFFHADLLSIQPFYHPAGLSESLNRRETFNLRPFNLITANLPYIPTARLENLEVARREPGLALDGGADGLDCIRRLLRDAPAALAPGGLALLEIDETQGEAACKLATISFPQAQVILARDLAGLVRLLEIST